MARGLRHSYRRWKRNRLAQAPSRWSGRLATVGVALLVLGALLIAIYVARLR